MEYISRILCVYTAILSFSIAAHAADRAIEIGNRRELFVDHHLIYDLKGSAELRIHHPVRREIVLVHDNPWEGNACRFHAAFKDGDKYRMYYKAWHTLEAGSRRIHHFRTGLGLRYPEHCLLVREGISVCHVLSKSREKCAPYRPGGFRRF